MPNHLCQWWQLESTLQYHWTEVWRDTEGAVTHGGAGNNGNNHWNLNPYIKNATKLLARNRWWISTQIENGLKNTFTENFDAVDVTIENYRSRSFIELWPNVWQWEEGSIFVGMSSGGCRSGCLCKPNQSNLEWFAAIISDRDGYLSSDCRLIVTISANSNLANLYIYEKWANLFRLFYLSWQLLPKVKIGQISVPVTKCCTCHYQQELRTN
jgi:hypothetical protein